MPPNNYPGIKITRTTSAPNPRKRSIPDVVVHTFLRVIEN